MASPSSRENTPIPCPIPPDPPCYSGPSASAQALKALVPKSLTILMKSGDNRPDVNII